MTRGVAGVLVVEALQVQHAMDHQSGRSARPRFFPVRIRFLAHDRRAQHDVAGAR